MRNKLNKVVLTGALAAALVAGTVVPAMPAFAAEDTSTKGTITIENAKKDQVYSIYKILSFKGDNNGKDGKGTYYLNGDAWDAFINTSGYFKVDDVLNDGNGHYAVTAATLSDSNAQQFAQDALKYAKSNGIGATYTYTATADGTGVYTDDKGNELDSVPFGYYLMGTTTGSLVALNTTNPNVTLEDKNSPAKVTKTEKDEESVNTYDMTGNDRQVGDTVSYVAKVDAYYGGEDYVLHDTMTDGLTFDGTVDVYFNAEKDNDGTKLSTDDYTFTTETTDGDAFEVKFSTEQLKSIFEKAGIGIADKAVHPIYVYYSAKVNSKAATSTDQTNKIVLYYGQNNHSDSTTHTYTYSFNLHKYSDKVATLAGAEFKLFEGTGAETWDSNTDNAGNASKYTAIKLIKVNDTTYRIPDAKEAADNNVAKVDTITTVDTKDITIQGLDNRKYFLIETKAPAGYNPYTNIIPAEITRTADKDGNATGGYTVKGEVENHTIKVLNNEGSLLPSTGGIGTTIFKVVGGVLVVAAAIYFVIRRKKMA